MDYERWVPIAYLLFGAVTLVNGLFYFQNDGLTLGTILLIIGGSLMIAVTAPALFGSDGWSLSESAGKWMFFGSLLGLILYFMGSVLSVVV